MYTFSCLFSADAIEPKESVVTAIDRVTDNKMQPVTANVKKWRFQVSILKFVPHQFSCLMVNMYNFAIHTEQCEIYDDDLDRLLTTKKLQERDSSTKCVHCQRCIKKTQSFMQWEYLEFCRTLCYELYIYDGNYKCASCSIECGPNIGPNICIIGNRQYYFCSDSCEKTFFELMKFCRFCRNIITFMNHLNGFCDAVCRNRFQQIYGNVENITEIPCHQCHLKKTVNCSLVVNKTVYEFCSFSCFFHLKTTNGLQPGKKYFFFEKSKKKIKINFKRKICSFSKENLFIFKGKFVHFH